MKTCCSSSSCRLDNVIYRLGLAETRRMARQLVVHGHILVNGKKVDIPSYSVKVGDVITLRERSREQAAFKALREGTGVVTPKWLTFDAQNLTGTVAAMPAREDIDCPIRRAPHRRALFSLIHGCSR